LSEHRRKRGDTEKVCGYCNRWNRNTSRAFIGLDYPQLQREGAIMFYRETAHEI
jgi:hypothetical protein